MKFRCLSDIVRVGDACAAADVELRVHATALVRGTRHLSSLPAMPSPPLPIHDQRQSGQPRSRCLSVCVWRASILQDCSHVQEQPCAAVAIPPL